MCVRDIEKEEEELGGGGGEEERTTSKQKQAAKQKRCCSPTHTHISKHSHTKCDSIAACMSVV